MHSKTHKRISSLPLAVRELGCYARALVAAGPALGRAEPWQYQMNHTSEISMP